MKPIEITLHGHFEARCDEYGLRTVRNRPRGSSPAPALPIYMARSCGPVTPPAGETTCLANTLPAERHSAPWSEGTANEPCLPDRLALERGKAERLSRLGAISATGWRCDLFRLRMGSQKSKQPDL